MLTIDKITPSASQAFSVITAEKADADSLADAPSRAARADRLDAASYFMTGHTRKPQTRE
jgi:hypothetical protein